MAPKKRGFQKTFHPKDPDFAPNYTFLEEKSFYVILLYMPHSEYPRDDFINIVESLSNLITENYDQRIQRIIGGDFNLVVFTGERGISIEDLCSEFNLNIRNSDMPSTDERNWIFQNCLG